MILALLLPLFSFQVSELTVQLKSESRAYGTEIELGEIASISGGTPEQLAGAKALELGYVPAPGYSRVLKPERIEALFRVKLPGIQVKFTGEAATRVYPMVSKVSGAEIIAAARAQLLIRYDSTQYSFQPRGGVNDVEVPEGLSVYQIQARIETAPSRSGFINIPVDILVDGQRFRTVWTGWDAVVWETRRVLSRDLRAGEVIQLADFSDQRIPVGLNAGPSLEAGLLPGAVAGHDLLKGTAVNPMDVIRPRVVQTQDLIRLRIQSGGITATVMASAMTAGAIGDRIRVRTLDKNVELTATIQSRDVCVLNLSK